MWISIILIALAASIDSLGLGIAYSLNKVRVPNSSRLVIVSLSIIYSFFALALGHVLYGAIQENLTKLFGIIIMVLVGIWIIIQSFIKKNTKKKYKVVKQKETTIFKVVLKSLGITIQVIRNPEIGDIDHSGTIDLKESIMLSIALSVDGIAVILGGTLLGFGSLWIPVILGIFQYTAFTLGYILFKKISFQCSDNCLLGAMPGIVLIVMAILKLVD